MRKTRRHRGSSFASFAACGTASSGTARVAGIAGSERGKAFFGAVSSGGPSTSPSATLNRGVAGAHFGSAIAGGEDVNLDGFDDVIIGEPDWSNNVNTPSEGLIEVFFGRDGGFTTANSSQSDCAACRAGAAVAMGNVDGEEHGDIAWSDPGKNLAGYPGEGMIVVRIGRW